MRVFVALELPHDFAADVTALARQLGAVVDGRFLPSGNRHLTLAFLGDVDQAGVVDATDALEAACAASSASVPLRSDGLGKFGRSRDATLWLGIAAQPELVDLAARLREELAARDVSFDDKPFRPHITLARRARIPEEPLPDLAFPRDDEAVRATLFKSTLDHNGATYQPLHTVDLGAGRA